MSKPNEIKMKGKIHKKKYGKNNEKENKGKKTKAYIYKVAQIKVL